MTGATEGPDSADSADSVLSPDADYQLCIDPSSSRFTGR